MGQKSRGFTLKELLVVIVILGVLAVIAVSRYSGVKSMAEESVCATNRKTVERMYHAYLLTENKEHTDNVFDEFMQNYEENICPDNGDIKYINGNVRCMLHSEDETNGNDDDESVPFL